MYKLKANKDLFDRWTKLAKKTNKKITVMDIVQNDMEVTNKQLNDWWKKSIDEIKKVDEDFKSIISELLSLRNETVQYLQDQIKGCGKQ